MNRLAFIGFGLLAFTLMAISVVDVDNGTPLLPVNAIIEDGRPPGTDEIVHAEAEARRALRHEWRDVKIRAKATTASRNMPHWSQRLDGIERWLVSHPAPTGA